MRVFVQCGIRGLPFNETVFNAYDGFAEMAAEIVFYNKFTDLKDLTREDIVVGGLGPSKLALEQLGCTYPELDYPEELTQYLGRKIWKDKIDHINSTPDMVFALEQVHVGKKTKQIPVIRRKEGGQSD